MEMIPELPVVVVKLQSPEMKIKQFNLNASVVPSWVNTCSGLGIRPDQRS